MITKDELLKAASKNGLTPNIVEKDYVLGWMIAQAYTQTRPFKRHGYSKAAHA
ncbi:MAG: hypothetical protein KAI76_03380 [Alphaproteobacteria bacterium]|nr:hypothetical protein [Alphaproteobacteria bacterium]